MGYLPTRPIGPGIYQRPGPPWWFLGCHGGAGADTVHAAIPGGVNAGRYWPIPTPPHQARIVLVTRSHASGLRAAQAAAQQWVSGSLGGGVRLLGLAVVADAPGRLPRPLRDLLGLISGGLPRVWQLPWVEAWRLGDPPDPEQLPAAYARLAADLHQLVTGGNHA